MIIDINIFIIILYFYYHYIIIIFYFNYISFQFPEAEKLSPYECGLIHLEMLEINLN
jgi:NADH:ubiquinone oxidoreductase subunit 3 (subunit A)